MSFHIGMSMSSYGGRRGEPSDLRLLTDDVLLHVVEAQADVDGQLVQPPRVLRVEAEVRVQVLLDLERRVQDRSRDSGDAVVVDLVEVGVGRVVAPVGTERILEADLDVVRAGHVRRGRGQVVAVGVVAELCARRRSR